jgi:hypothetical protein
MGKTAVVGATAVQDACGVAGRPIHPVPEGVDEKPFSLLHLSRNVRGYDTASNDLTAA